MRHEMLLACSVLWVACGSEPMGTSPSELAGGGSDLASASSRSAQAGTLSGRVLDAITGEAVPRARIELGGAGSVTTRADGSFSIALPTTAVSAHPLSVDAAGFWTRQSHASSSSVRTVDLTLFSTEEPFDLDFFDHVFRDLGERGTRPWSVEPVFEIWTKVFDCVDMRESGVCDELEATAQDVPTLFLQHTRDVIENDTHRYTGRAIHGVQVTELAHPVGTRIPHAMQSEIGKITIAMVQFPHNTSWARSWSFTRGDKSRAHIQMNKRHKDRRGIYSHELAHTLGFRHPLGSENVPRPSIMRRGHGPEPTRHDVLHGRLMYMRPPNSMTPDRDPDGFLLNALHAVGGDLGAEIETVDP